MEVNNRSRRKEGKRARKTFLKGLFGILSCIVFGTIIYSIFSEFNDTDHLAQAKIEINVGSEQVEAYANIQVQLDGEVIFRNVFIKLLICCMYCYSYN